MRIPATMSERAASLVIGTALSMVGVFLITLGMTILPIFGIVVAVPVITLAFYIFRTAKWSIVEEKETVTAETIAEHPVTA